MTKLGSYILAVALLLVMATPALAIVTPGDQFTITFSETSPLNIPDAGTAIVTVDGPSATPGFDLVSGLSVIGQGGTCFTCGLISEDLSKVLFNTTSLDLLGTVTGSFLGSGGGLHTFTLDLTDAPNPTWLFTNVRVSDQHTEISSGAYVTAVAVPQPSGVLLVGGGLMALAGFIASRRFRRASPSRS